MKIPIRIPLLALLLALPLSGYGLEPTAQREIDYLIAQVKQSGYRFVRNGSEHTAEEGAEHLRTKLSRAGGRVKTAEDFISGIASKSYLSGEIYMVKTPEGKTFPAGKWLTALLAKYRTEPHPAPSPVSAAGEKSRIL